MNWILGIFLGLGCLLVSVWVTGYGLPAVLLCLALIGLFCLALYQFDVDRKFMLTVFSAALLVRMLVGAGTFIFNLQAFFGGDSISYDLDGYSILRMWQGHGTFVASGESGGVVWGMPYLVAAVYAIVGRNMLAVQFVNAAAGAATILPVYLCAQHIFQNVRTARLSALLVAFFPSLILWSSQGLKDAPIIFLLAVVMLATLKLGERLSVKYFAVLVCALLGLLSLRFYIFYMVAAAVAGSFIIGMRPVSARNLGRQFVLIICVGLALTQFGVLSRAGQQLQTYGNLDAIQRSRQDLSHLAGSGFGKDVDVSTTGGALSAIPLGVVYLLFAPFPWQVTNLRQTITLPEMLVWWSMFPLLVLGLWFTLKHRLRQALPIVLFTFMLTLAYSIFQGNVGTAYRQRAQLLIFYFMFVAVGYVLLKERREERQLRQQAARQAAYETGLALRRYERWRREKEKELEKIAEDLQKSLGF